MPLTALLLECGWHRLNGGHQPGILKSAQCVTLVLDESHTQSADEKVEAHRGYMSLGPGSKMEEALGAHECVSSSAHLEISDPTSGGHSTEQMFFTSTMKKSHRRQVSWKPLIARS